MAKRLLDKGADPTVQETYGPYKQQTLLMVAAENGHDAMVKLLLEAGANPNLKSTGFRPHGGMKYFSRTPLSLAAENGDEAVTSLLLNQKHIQANLKDNAGRTPFYYALVNGHIYVANKLMLSGGSFTGEKLEPDRYFNRQSPRMPAEQQDLVWIRGLDKATIEVERDVAEQSMLIKSMLQLIGNGSSSQENPIQLPYANGTILRKVFRWCKQHRDTRTTTRRIRSLQTKEWDQNYMQVNRAHVMEITQAAWYLGIDRLWRLGCKIVALEMRDQSAEEKIREYLNITNNFTLELKAEICLQYVWPTDGRCRATEMLTWAFGQPSLFQL
ncbi:SKP1 component [Metarhizium robertsii ARSEF 23]|uniref:SKP1 component n=1 Tax=Metarhizium robertsii (strain ARSEF 23 / ATCC MYA-3075) TaxID=655844 RepID=E9F3X5_METRA|nr:SKP1 component [Metarhizium robertsii ARSEF 23]EFY97661.2 SKP1 component [Metarhizium robertsii ARSEF 23]